LRPHSKKETKKKSVSYKKTGSVKDGAFRAVNFYMTCEKRKIILFQRKKVDMHYYPRKDQLKKKQLIKGQKTHLLKRDLF